MDPNSYTPLEGDTVYDVAARLYDDVPLGVADIVALNPQANLLDLRASGTVLYTPGLKRNVERILVPVTNTDPTFTSRDGQSHYDLAIQLYGSIDGLGKIIRKLPTLDNDVPAGTVLQYPFEKTKNGYFFSKNICATWAPAPVIPGGDSFELREDGGFELREDGGKEIRN